jgi:hypothetical protein
MQPLRGGVHLRAQAKLPSQGGHLHKVQQEGPPRGHLPQRETFERKRASCFASATAESGATTDFQEFKAFKQHQRQQLQQRHQQQQQQQNEECAQIASDFGTWTPFDTCNVITEIIKNVNACTPTPPLFLHLKPIGKPTFRIQVLADTEATRSLISLSTATKHGCKIKETNVCLSAANGTKIDVAGMTSLQVVEKGRLVYTIVAILSQNVTQTIVGWKDLMAMGVISLDWPAIPQQEDKIPAADDDDEEKQLGELKINMLNKYNTVFSDTINEKPIAGTPMKIHLMTTSRSPRRSATLPGPRSSSKSWRQQESFRRSTSQLPGQAQDSSSSSPTGGSSWSQTTRVLQE